jgi:hypothetical protein
VSNELGCDKFLNVLARAVEKNPSDKRYWYTLANILTSAPPGIECDSETGQHWQHQWERRKNEWADNFFHSPPGSATIVKPSFVSMVLETIESELSLVKEERGNDGFGSCNQQEDTPLEMISSEVVQKERSLSADPVCEALCLRVIVAHYIIGHGEFVSNSIWWLAVKHWKSCQSKTSNDYLDGLKWLSKRGLNVLEYITKRCAQSNEHEQRLCALNG